MDVSHIVVRETMIEHNTIEINSSSIVEIGRDDDCAERDQT